MHNTQLPARIEYGPDAGKYPAYTWPGAYPLIYWDVYGNVLCADCASLPSDLGSDVVGCDTFLEGPDTYCDNCGTSIESSYGAPDADDDDAQDD